MIEVIEEVNFQDSLFLLNQQLHTAGLNKKAFNLSLYPRFVSLRVKEPPVLDPPVARMHVTIGIF